MKLAFCLYKYFPYGGMQRDFIRIAQACHRRGHEIHVFTSSWEGERDHNFHIHFIKVRALENHTRLRHFSNQFQASVEGENFDLVIGFNKMPHLDVYFAADVCFKARTKQKHGLLYRWLPRYRQLSSFEHAVFASGQETKIMVLSQQQIVEFTQHYQTESSRFYLLPPGISKDRIPSENAQEIRAEIRKAFKVSDDEHVILMIGSGFKTKGLDRAIIAIASLSKTLQMRCQLFVIGQDHPAFFQKMAERYGVSDRIRFLGGRLDVPNFLLAADLLIHPAYHENTGTVILEAIVSGLPVLTTDVCGYAHFVDDAKAGIVLKSPFKQSELNNSLENMLLSDECVHWKKNGLAFAKQEDLYSMTETAASLIDLIPSNTLKRSSFKEMMSLRGECFRQQKNRLTQRVQINGQYYFIKQFTEIGWREILKNLFQLRWPVLSAKNEYQAIQKLESLNIAVPNVIAYQAQNKNPAHRKSFILMQEIANAESLEEVCATWCSCPPQFNFKLSLTKQVSHIASSLHENGINHRDFYICHFLYRKSQAKLYLIDLHRAQLRGITPKRWQIKDLAGLYFSSKDIGLTQRDYFRFMRFYRHKSLREILQSETPFWQKVKERGEKLYRDHGK